MFGLVLLQLIIMQNTQRKISSLKFKSKTPNKPQQSTQQKSPQNNPFPQPPPQTTQQPTTTTTTTTPIPPPPIEDGKTLAQKSFELVKKRRLIEKAHDKVKTSNKDRLQKWKKTLSKQPDHYDLAKIGEKIQKGY